MCNFVESSDEERNMARKEAFIAISILRCGPQTLLSTLCYTHVQPWVLSPSIKQEQGLQLCLSH